MVRPTTLLTLALLPALSFGQFAAFEKVQQVGETALRTVLSKVFRMSEAQVDKAMTKDPPMAPHPYAVDLTDSNWQEVTRTGGVDTALASSLPSDTVWVIAVYAIDGVSKLFIDGFNDVASYNSSRSGGSLPENMLFARLDYTKETMLPTKLWLWKVPILVIATNNMKDLRFFKLGEVSPFQKPMAELLQNRKLWHSKYKWEGALAPGGALEPYVDRLGRFWSLFHQYFSKVPNFLLLIGSGMMMNFVLGFFHSNKAPKAAVEGAGGEKGKTTTTTTAKSTAVPSGSSTATQSEKKASKRK